jgi:DNA/RNA-binding domain of Phe-tRNA-synthetase-like protein
MNIIQCKHPLLYTVVFHTVFCVPAGLLTYSEKLSSLLRGTATPDFQYDERITLAIRTMMRVGGYKPAGRGKPSSEYLCKLNETNSLPRVNAVVDIGNIVSCYTGIPLSVVDKKKISGNCCIRFGNNDEKYVFNPSGQIIDCKGLVLFSDSDGPCANPVKDAMRTKTDAGTLETITILWGSKDVSAVVNDAFLWYKEIIADVDKNSYVEQCMIIE